MIRPQIPHYMAFHITAQELAQHPEFQDEQQEICYRHGIPLNDMTDDEIKFLSNLVEEYYNKGV